MNTSLIIKHTRGKSIEPPPERITEDVMVKVELSSLSFSKGFLSEYVTEIW